MSDKKISQLSAADTLVGDEQVPIVQGGVTKRTTLTEVLGTIGTDEVDYAEITADSAAAVITTGTNVVGLSIDVTADGNTDYYLEIEGTVGILFTDTALVAVRIMESSTVILSSMVQQDHMGAAVGAAELTFHPIYKRRRIRPTAGTHTYFVNFLLVTATATSVLEASPEQVFSISARRI